MTAETPMRWPRPRPLIGDATSSAERASDPASWALSSATRTALAEVIAARRDVRRFRPDPVSDEIVAQVLAAGHAAPSVGHSQPWRFIVVQDPGLRASAAVMADRARLAQARPCDLPRYRSVVLCLRHREHLADRPGTRAGPGLGHPLRTRRAGRAAAPARRGGDARLAVPRLAGRAAAGPGTGTARLVQPAPPNGRARRGSLAGSRGAGRTP